MARRPRASRLENRTARLKLPIRINPHDYTLLAPGIAVIVVVMAFTLVGHALEAVFDPKLRERQ